MSIRYSTVAVLQLDSIGQYIALDSPLTAQVVIMRIRAAVGRLQTFPRSGRSGSAPGTFELVIKGLPYIIVYEVKQNVDVTILNVFHGAQDR